MRRLLHAAPRPAGADRRQAARARGQPSAHWQAARGDDLSTYSRAVVGIPVSGAAGCAADRGKGRGAGGISREKEQLRRRYGNVRSAAAARVGAAYAATF